MSKKPPVQMQNLRRVQLPFQYTDEGRKQIAEKQKLLPRFNSDNRASPLDPLSVRAARSGRVHQPRLCAGLSAAGLRHEGGGHAGPALRVGL